MKLLARILAVVLLSGASTAPVRAEPPALFRAGLVDPVKLLPAPAALDTEEMRAELQTVLRVQESRTDKEVKRARADEKIRTDSFQTALGPWLTANNLPRLQALFERMEKEARVHSDIAKIHFKRPRPFVADPRVKPLFEQSDPGYPSGHALRGQMFALVLSELAPDKAETLLARGREIGWSRVVGGVHFPSDVSAGRTLGQALAREMLANPAIRTELAEIHREFDAARQQSPGPVPCTRWSHRSKLLKKVRLSAGYEGVGRRDYRRGACRAGVRHRDALSHVPDRLDHANGNDQLVYHTRPELLVQPSFIPQVD